MHPVLLRLPWPGGLFELHSFGVLVAAGCAVAIAIALREADRRGCDRDAVRDLCFWALVAGLLGARLVYVIASGRGLLDDCLDAAAASGLRGAFHACTRPLRLWEGGLVFYGGVASGAAAALWFGRRRGLPFARLGDILSPSLAAGHAIGRLGCFLAGCCFGKATMGALGVSFPDGSVALQELQSQGLLGSLATRTPPLHPTQLYEAGGELLLFLLLLRLGRVAYFRARDGRLTLAYLGLYSAMRFVLEVFRGDVVRGFVWRLSTPSLNRALSLPPAEPSLLSTSQAVAVVVIAASLVALVASRPSARATDGEPVDRGDPVP